MSLSSHLNFGVIMNYFRKRIHTISVQIRTSYNLVSKEADCKPDTGWLGKMDIGRCADICSRYYELFVHATDGDRNCKCITTDDCTPTKDIHLGLALYKTNKKGRKEDSKVAIFYPLYWKILHRHYISISRSIIAFFVF